MTYNNVCHVCHVCHLFPTYILFFFIINIKLNTNKTDLGVTHVTHLIIFCTIIDNGPRSVVLMTQEMTLHPLQTNQCFLGPDSPLKGTCLLFQIY